MSESTKAFLRRDFRDLLLLVLALVVLSLSFSLQLFLPEISSSSEAREAEVLRSVLRDGEIVLPRRHGVLPSKPPLLHWLGAATGYLAETIIRIEIPEIYLARSASLFGFFVVLALLFALAPRRVGLHAALIFASCYGASRLAADARVDMLFGACVSIALFPFLGSYLQSLARREKLQPEMNWFWIGAGFSVLGKGPLGLALCGLLAFSLSWLQFGFLKSVKLFARPRLSWLIFFCLTTGWYWLAYQAAGEGILARQLFFENVQRFSGGEHIVSKPFWYYIPAWLRLTAPWSLVALTFFFLDFKKLKSDEALRSIYRLLLPLALVTIFFSLSSGKRASYLIPLLPIFSLFVALRLAYYWDGLSFYCRKRRLGRISQVYYLLCGFGLLCLLLISVLQYWGPADERLLSVVEAGLSAAALFALLVFVLLLAAVVARGRFYFQRVLLLKVALMSSLLALGNSSKASLRSFELTSNSLLTELGTGELAVLRPFREEYYDPVLYYLRAYSKELKLELIQPADLQQMQSSFLLVKRKVLDEYFPAGLPGSPRLVGSYSQVSDRLKGRKDRDLLLFEMREVKEET